jgi:hypothetical protein
MKTIIISASDQNYLPLLTGLLDSIAKLRKSTFDIGILDLGFDEPTVAKLR